MSENVRLSRNQKRALAAILANKSLTAAAEVCGLSEKTLRRYMDDPAFQQALQQAESELITGARRRLISGLDTALDTLAALASGFGGVSNSDQRHAAVAWVKLWLQLRDQVEIEDRLSDLERMVYHGKQKH